MATHPSRLPAGRLPAALFAALVCALLPCGARAQVGAIESDPSQGIGPMRSARNTIQGQVALPSGMRLERRAKVRISGATGGTLFTFTDDNGNFAFRRLAAGTYYLTVDAGPEFHTANETVDIFPGPGAGSTQTVYVQLRYKASSAGKPGTIDSALADVPKPALKLYEKAMKAAQAGEDEKAIEALKAAVELYPRFMLAFSELGLQYMRAGKLDEAAQALRSALEISPDAAAPNLNVGILHFYRNDMAAADRHLRLVLQKQDNSSLAHFFLGRVLLRQRNYVEAEKALRRAVTIGGGEVNEGYRFLGGIYKETGDSARAVEALEKYLALEPKARDADSIREIIKQLRKQTASARP